MIKKYLFAVIALLVGNLSGVASAQVATKSVGTSGQVSNQPNESQVNEGQAIVARGESLSTRVSSMLEAARKEADIIRINCLNEKLTQINANLRNAQKRLEAFMNAVDNDKRSHEYNVLTVLGQKLQSLDQESNSCVGQEIYETGATRVETDIDTSIVPNPDPTQVYAISPGIPVIPAEASAKK